LRTCSRKLQRFSCSISLQSLLSLLTNEQEVENE
jgi:hypothetical protein